MNRDSATVAQLVEQLICNQLAGGSSPLGGSISLEKAGVAQLVERQPSKLNVVGSTPITRSILIQ